MHLSKSLSIFLITVAVTWALQATATQSAPLLAKKSCHTVTKKVHGHKKKVKVCKRVSTRTPTPMPTATATATATDGPAVITSLHDVSVNLFEWNWDSVASECTNVLGPAGYGSVQVAPPQDSLNNHGRVWWDVYQPADYNLTSRMGNEAQFRAMVNACRHAGVKVLVDAVINHMAGGSGTAVSGYTYDKYDHPGLFTTVDFHHYPADCPQPSGQIRDFNDYTEVTQCELLGLADLNTQTSHVRSVIAGYLNTMIDAGVSGFRVDAAKHIGETDLAAIEAMLHRTLDGEIPYMALEVMPGGPGQLAPAAFEGQGSLLQFDYATALKEHFLVNLAHLKTFDSWGMLPSAKSLTFVENHDTERNGSTLSYKDGATNILATEFLLAFGYGTPQVYASFNWARSDDSPPSDANGAILNTTCGAGWTCTDRVPAVIGMVRWHNDVGTAPVADWYDNGANLIAFSRGTRGWIAINNESTAQTRTFATGLAAGTYCDVIHGTQPNGSCSGQTVTVDGQGAASVTIPAKDSVAIAITG